MRSLRWNTFGRALLFAAFVGAAYLPAALLLPSFGLYHVPALFFPITCALYVTGAGPRFRPALGAGAGIIALGIYFGALPPYATMLLSVVMLSTFRSGLIFRQSAVRGIAVEAILGGLSLGAAFSMFDGTPIGTALGIWAFFLVQSCYTLVGGGPAARAVETKDAFQSATRRAYEILSDS